MLANISAYRLTNLSWPVTYCIYSYCFEFFRMRLSRMACSISNLLMVSSFSLRSTSILLSYNFKLETYSGSVTVSYRFCNLASSLSMRLICKKREAFMDRPAEETIDSAATLLRSVGITLMISESYSALLFISFSIICTFVLFLFLSMLEKFGDDPLARSGEVWSVYMCDPI